jgi:hypothetical protein
MTSLQPASGNRLLRYVQLEPNCLAINLPKGNV